MASTVRGARRLQVPFPVYVVVVAMVSGDTRSPSGLSGIPSRGTIGQQSLIGITDSTGPRTRLRSNSTSAVQLNCGSVSLWGFYTDSVLTMIFVRRIGSALFKLHRSSAGRRRTQRAG